MFLPEERAVRATSRTAMDLREVAVGTVMRAIGAAVLSVSVLACSHRAKPKQESGPPPRTTVTVDNQSFLDMTVFVVVGGQRIRLGQATGSSKSRFTIPAYLIGNGIQQLRFVADPIGSNRLPISDEISVSAGDEVVLTIPPT